MDIQELLQVSVRAIVSLITLFFITKLLGKKQVSQLSVFDYVIGISIGNFAAEITTSIDTQLSNGILAMISNNYKKYCFKKIFNRSTNSINK